MLKKKVYTIATAHLDTVWSWDLKTTAQKYIYNTLINNFELFEKYPDYVFSFEGSYRYELMQEYYPELFEKLKEYVKEGRWNVTGSAYENGDVNCPSPEALIRNILIGNSYFDETFSKRSCDIFLPDCFGFGWTLPSIARHMNLIGFTTQKLGWGGAYGIPFDLGKWYGVDGEYIFADLNPGEYGRSFKQIRGWDFIDKKLAENEKNGLDCTCVFHGTGDRGGSPTQKSVEVLENEIKKNGSDNIEVISATADEIFRDLDRLSQDKKDRLPSWNTELVMTNHGVGGYTSRSIGKRWNDRGQVLADMAERSGVMAEYFGTSKYNEQPLETAWKRLIAHQFHDDTPGTSCQRVYKRSWNDYALSSNQFKNEHGAYLESLTKLMDSKFCEGTPIMVSNSCEFERTSAVKFEIENIKTSFVRVFDNDGNEVPSQILARSNNKLTVEFSATVGALGLRVYDLRESEEPCQIKTELTISENCMENTRYKLILDSNGNISSVIDKADGNRELLKAPVVLGIFNYTGSKDWPAWEMNYKEADKKPDYIPELVSVNIVENGPVSVAFEVLSKHDRSTFKNYIRLTDNGNCIEVYSEIEWQSLRTMCKNIFEFTAENEEAAYDLGLGAIKRKNMTEKLFEVPAQNWADITDKSGNFGISVISECKHGWDKFDNHTLRLTVLHTPKRNYRIDSMQSMMDLGKNLYSFAIYSHKGASLEGTQIEAKSFITPMVAVSFPKHTGTLESSYSFLTLSDARVTVRALKKKHHTNEEKYVVRFNENSNSSVNSCKFSLGNGIAEAYEAWGSEEFKTDAKIQDGNLIFNLKPYEIKTFVISLSPYKEKQKPTENKAVKLDFNTDINYIPENLRKDKISACGVEFKLLDKAMCADGQSITVNDGKKVILFCTNLKNNEFVNNAYEEFAHWDLYDFYETAYIKDGKLGYEFTHYLGKDGNIKFAESLYFWIVELDKTTVLPKNKNIVILAATEIENSNSQTLTELFDKIENNRPFTFKMTSKEKIRYLLSKCVFNLNDKNNFLSHYNNGRNGKRVEQTGKRYRTVHFK